MNLRFSAVATEDVTAGKRRAAVTGETQTAVITRCVRTGVITGRVRLDGLISRKKKKLDIEIFEFGFHSTFQLFTEL